MKNFGSEDVSLFEELYTGLSQAIEFTQGTCEAKIAEPPSVKLTIDTLKIFDENQALLL